MLFPSLILCLVWKHCRKSLPLSLTNANVAFLGISWSNSKLDPFTWVFIFWGLMPLYRAIWGEAGGWFNITDFSLGWKLLYDTEYSVWEAALSVWNIQSIFKRCFRCENFRQTDSVANLALESPPICSNPNPCWMLTFPQSLWLYAVRCYDRQ